MRYDAHLAAGLPIGSGTVEAGCKNVVGRRMECTGMRWSVGGANPVLRLRCAWLGGYWDDRIDLSHTPVRGRGRLSAGCGMFDSLAGCWLKCDGLYG